MTLVFAVIVVLIATATAIASLRGRYATGASTWFIILSLIFVNIGFLLHNLSTWETGVSGSINGVLVTSLGLLCFVGGVVLTRSFFRQADRRRASVKEGPYVNDALATRQLVAVAAVVFLPSWTYFVLLGYVPLFEGLMATVNNGLDGIGELQASRLSRDAFASEHGTRIPGQGVMQMFRNLGVPIVVGIAVAQLQSGRPKRFRYATIGISILTVLLAGQRWGLIYVLVAALIALIASSGKFPTRPIVIVSTTVFAVGVFISVLQGRTLMRLDSWLEASIFAFNDLVGRIFVDQVRVPIMSYENLVFPPGELLGRSYWESLSAYLPGAQASFPVEFYTRVTGDLHEYTAAPDFYTEAYINFGVLGVIAMSALWGVFLTAFDRLILHESDDLSRGLKAAMATILGLTAFTGIVFSLSILVVVIPCLVVIRCFAPRPRLGEKSFARMGKSNMATGLDT